MEFSVSYRNENGETVKLSPVDCDIYQYLLERYDNEEVKVINNSYYKSLRDAISFLSAFYISFDQAKEVLRRIESGENHDDKYIDGMYLELKKSIEVYTPYFNFLVKKTSVFKPKKTIVHIKNNADQIGYVVKNIDMNNFEFEPMLELEFYQKKVKVCDVEVIGCLCEELEDGE